MKSNFEQAIGEGVKEGYHALFQTYPNAHHQDQEALFRYFKGQTSESNDKVKNMVKAFSAFVDLSKIDALQDEVVNDQGRMTVSSSVTDEQEDKERSKEVVAVNVNIQLQVPLDSSGDSYEKFFEAMRKYLLS